jgi:predicted nucleotidyltransferase component of viral defense system
MLHYHSSMDLELLSRVKRLALTALVSDDELMDLLVLKGGNALDLVYKIAERSSVDLDFSIRDSFEDTHLDSLEARIGELLTRAFGEEGYHAHDVKLTMRPRKMNPDVASFWGGYRIEFKIIASTHNALSRGNIDAVRRESLPIGPDMSTNFRIEISRFEHVPQVEPVYIDGYKVNVYTPTLIAIEKLRAICQQTEEYKLIVPSATTSARARDFFDIYTIVQHCQVDLLSPENRTLIGAVFTAKRVPLELLKNLESYRDFHFQDFMALRDTVMPGVELKEFDFYFDFVKDIAEQL